ncbi:hypothetical protein PXK00_12505 [Phaeobacter sp. QD34_3]|uniref:hypothetical protein n=1 Tax=unclassified Phaeobacter TaxID=2621772 RepID=UPI00237F4878|nr:MULTISPECIES: hypothetical protein [unclassified Phaeobacter]MDE4133936.1 hypothetical protein [Phaeobacter sp. QD34_3]MDE4137607.1 hypothetical protein [Phaeobacter sp. QD34_24]MDE4175619.1 hypothetical protein [Phaeobacter sp. PT47_59]
MEGELPRPRVPWLRQDPLAALGAAPLSRRGRRKGRGMGQIIHSKSPVRVLYALP